MHPDLSFLADSGSIQRAGLQSMPAVLMLSLAVPDPHPPSKLGL